MLFSVFLALAACMRAQFSSPTPVIAIPAFPAVPSSASLTCCVRAPLGSLIVPCFTSPHQHGDHPTPSPSQGMPREHVRALHNLSLTSLPRADTSLAPRAAPSGSYAWLDPSLSVGVPSSMGSSHLESLPLAPLAPHLSLPPLLAARASAVFNTQGSMLATSDQGLAVLELLSQASLLEWCTSLAATTTTSPRVTCFDYHYHYLVDWVRLVDFEFVWSRWFPVTLAIRPRSKWGPQPSKHVFLALWDIAHSLVFTSKGRQGALLSVCLPLFCQNFTWCVEDALNGSIRDLVQIPSQFIFFYVFFSTIFSLITYCDFTLPLPNVNFTRPFLWMLISFNLPLGQSVCLSCAGNDPNCPGDNTCILARALISNVAVIAGATGAATTLTMGDAGKHILPLSWLQILKPSVLNTLQALSKRAPSGTPLDVTSLSVSDLSAAIAVGRISVEDGRFEFIRRMSDDAVSDALVSKLEKICSALPLRSQDAKISAPRAQTSGALSFVFAISSQVVHRLSVSSKASLTLSDSTSSFSTSTISMDLKRPLNSDAFSHMLVVWQSILSATGLANAVILGPFLVEVVYDIIPFKGWKVAFEHFLLYINKIDSGCGWQLATATSLGSVDTFLAKAVKAAGPLDEKSQPPPGQSPPSTGANSSLQITPPVWNGKFNSDALARPCAAYNLGQDHIKLNADGSCPFNHVCNQWVSGKGPGAQCKSKHPRVSCDNSSKCQSRVN